MHLYKTGHEFEGYYYYDSKQEPVYFIGDDTTEKGNIKLTVFLPGNNTDENFIFWTENNSITGEWHTTGKARPLNFSAKEINPASFEYVFSEGNTKLKPQKKDSPAATWQAASIWPKGNSNQTDFLKRIITESFGEKNSTEDIGKIFLRIKKKFFADYLSEYKDVKDEEISEDAIAYNLDEKDRLMVVYQSAKLFTLANSSYSYTGGAHGNYGTSYSSLDLQNKKKLKLDEILTSAGIKQLSKLLEKHFRKAYSLKENAALSEGGLFEDKIEPNDNFYVTGKGIGFNYTPYEIGPYAMGEINIFIPFTELSTNLQEGFKKLLK